MVSVAQFALGCVINNSQFSAWFVQLKQLPMVLSRFVAFMMCQVPVHLTASPLLQNHLFCQRCCSCITFFCPAHSWGFSSSGEQKAEFVAVEISAVNYVENWEKISLSAGVRTKPWELQQHLNFATLIETCLEGLLEHLLLCLTGTNSSTNLIWSFTDRYHPHAMRQIGL